MNELLYTPAHKQRELILHNKLSALELTCAYIDQIHKINPALNALVTLDFDQALATAKQLDQHLHATGKPKGLLHGLPLAVKDVFNTKGLRTTFGNPLFRHHLPIEDDILVAREKLAGAVILGKSNTPDCASGGITNNEIFGLTHNPWDNTKTTSGSGGGGIAALLGGMVSLADGSDIGGSVRSPACWSSCVGYRPTSGLIPGLPGQAADGDTSTAGIFARCVTDAALFMQAVQGPSPLSAVTYPKEAEVDWQRLTPAKTCLPIGWQPDFAHMHVHADVADSFACQAAILEQAGFSLSDEPIQLGANYRDLYRQFNAWRFFACLPDKVQTAALAGESKASHNDYADFMRNTSALEIQTMLLRREHLRVAVRDYFSRHSVLATPVHAGLAFGVDDYLGEGSTDWSPLYLAPLLGLPSVCVPCGFTNDGMPNGMLLTGPASSDQLLLQIAYGFETARGLPVGQPDLTWCSK